jgi:hypothetical protein
MSIKGHFHKIELLASGEPMRETSIGLILFRQTEWGKRSGETLLQLWDWDSLQEDELPKPTCEACADKRILIQIARAALLMAGREDLADTLPGKSTGQGQLNHSLVGERCGQKEGTYEGIERRSSQGEPQEEEGGG